MKITCDRQQLLNAFQTAATVAPSRSPKPILQNVKLSVEEKEAVVIATDTEVGIRLTVPGIEIAAPGSIILPVARFGSILRESSDEKLQLETDGSQTKVSGQRSQFSLPAENPDEFPEVETFEEEKFHELPSALMKELVRRTLFATDTESSRYALGGVLLEFEDDKIVAVGTDGRRLAKMEGPAQAVGDHGNSEAMTIVPSRAMLLIDRAISDGDADVRLAARSNDILLRTSQTTIYSRLVEGRYPKWREVIPTRQDTKKIDLAVGPLYSSVRQAAIVASEESRGLEFQFQDGLLVMSGKTAEVGSSRVEMPVPYDGDPVTISLDHRFISDFLKVLDLEKIVTLEIENNDSAALFTTDEGYAYVVMPLSRT